MDSVYTVIIMIGIFGGAVIGGVTGYLMGKKSSKPAEKIMAGSSVNLVDPAQVKKPEMTKDGYHSLFHLWRKNENLSLEMGGIMFAERKSLSPEKISELKKTGYDLMAWLGEEVMPAQQAAVKPELRTTTKPLTPEPQPEQHVGPVPTVQSPTFVEAITKKIDLESGQKKYITDSIAEQIDDILQQKIVESGSPQIIRISEDANRNVVFHVGANSYVGLDKVQDAEAVRLIRLAIAEWEKKTASQHRR